VSRVISRSIVRSCTSACANAKGTPADKRMHARMQILMRMLSQNPTCKLARTSMHEHGSAGSYPPLLRRTAPFYRGDGSTLMVLLYACEHVLTSAKYERTRKRAPSKLSVCVCRYEHSRTRGKDRKTHIIILDCM
jgi:hypothetical protein